MDYPKVKKNQTKKTSIPTGQFDSKVIKVANGKNYREGEAILLTYELSRNGKTYEKTETFVNTDANPRSKQFFDYLRDNGVTIDTYEDFLGICEKLTLEKEVINGYTYTNINPDKREFVGKVVLEE